jgi:hypothetical protein
MALSVQILAASMLLVTRIKTVSYSVLHIIQFFLCIFIISHFVPSQKLGQCARK